MTSIADGSVTIQTSSESVPSMPACAQCMRASIRICRPCPLREQCQWNGNATAKPEPA